MTPEQFKKMRIARLNLLMRRRRMDRYRNIYQGGKYPTPLWRVKRIFRVPGEYKGPQTGVWKWYKTNGGWRKRVYQRDNPWKRRTPNKVYMTRYY